MVDLWMIATDLINWCIGEREWLKIAKEGERIMSGDGCRIMSGDGCTLPWKNGDELSQRRRRYKIFFFTEKLCFHAPFFVCTTNAFPCQQKGFNR